MLHPYRYLLMQVLTWILQPVMESLPLMCAAQANQLRTAALLNKAGADVNARASLNRSALRYAISGRFAEMTKIRCGIRTRKRSKFDVVQLALDPICVS